MLAAVAGAAAAPALFELARLLRKSRAARTGRPVPVVARRSLAFFRAVTPALPSDLQARAEAAQLPPGLDAQALIGLKFLLAGGSGVLLFLAASLALLPAAPLFLLLVPAGAFLLPDLVLGRRAKRIRDAVLDEVPAFADRLHMAVCAGLPPLRAAGVACAGGEGPLSREVAASVAAAEAGASFSGSLDRLTRRCPGAEVRAIAAALRRSQEQGTDIAPLLLEISGSARREASLRMRDRAQRAAPKIQLAVALLLVPAAMALIAAALLSGLFSA